MSLLFFCQLSDEKWDLMLIREDQVYPSMTKDYEMSLMDLKDFLTEKNVKWFNYFTHLQDDYIFMHVTPIDHFKDLGKGIHSLMLKKAEDPLDYHKKLQNTAGLLGEKGVVLWEKMIGYINENKAVEGLFIGLIRLRLYATW